MRERFGGGFEDGAAGENLIVDDDRVHRGMAGPLFIVTATGPALLVDVTAASPPVSASWGVG